MFSGFVVFFCCLSFLRYRFSSGFVVFFRGLGFLSSGFGGGFVVFFRGLSFLFSGWFGSGFVVFFMMGGLGSGAVSCSSRSLSGAYCVSSESSRRQTHSSGNDQS
ncbi:hypothetical protein AYO04_03480 [Raoultella planticola]|nr:hypothetical protein AYO04_03480 [Raoultella planticola]